METMESTISANGDQFRPNDDGTASDYVFTTFRDRGSALWQSVVEEMVAKQHSAMHGKMAAAPTHRHIAVRTSHTALAATRTVESHGAGTPSTGTAPHMRMAAPKPKGGLIDEAKSCSDLGYELGQALVQGDLGRARVLEDRLTHKFSTCDLRWAKCAYEYAKYFKIEQHQIPYRPDIDNVLPFTLPTRCVVGVIGDWGTGTDEAVAVLEQLGRKKPDLLIHLGDIYYSGLQSEVQASFLDIYRDVIGDTPVYSLAGNHDMYSGGEGYYALVNELKQRASYFCIRNSSWQFIAVDTGYFDYNPGEVDTVVTRLTDSEAAWVKAKISEGAETGLRTCLLSHHQPFSAFDKIGDGFENDRLLGQLTPELEKVDIWLWGHEHRLDVYGPHRGVKRGRCLGCSAVPVYVSEDYVTPRTDKIPLLTNPKTGKPYRVDADDNGTFYNLAFATMRLDGKNARVEYYQSCDEDNPLFDDEIA
jgi:predicted phosphodiesterase